MFKSLIVIQLCLFAVISSSDGSIFDSIVSVNREDNGNKKVGVHLPFIYWMDLNRNNEGPKLDLSVLGGLVKVNVDRKKQAGKGRPVMVRLLGAKIYNSYPENYGQTDQQANYQSEDTKAAAKPTSTDYTDSKPVLAQESAVTESKVAASDAPAGTQTPAAN